MKLMSNEGWFNGVLIQRAVLMHEKEDPSFFENTFGLKNYQFFRSYLKFFLQDAMMGGQYIDITEKDIEQGIVNQAIKKLSEKPPLKGGDPSAPYIFYAAKPEESMKMKMNTGKSNFRLNDKYIEF